MSRGTNLSFGFIALLALLTPAVSSANPVEYTVTVNTSSISGQVGFIDMQFDGASTGSQPANAYLSYFSTDGTLQGFSAGSPYADEIGDVTGVLPGDLSFDNAVSGGATDYAEQIQFGNSIQFYLTLSGPALDKPNGSGGGDFILDFYDSSFNELLTDNGNYVMDLNIGTDGSVTADLPTYSSGPPVVSLTGIPEPSTLLLFTGVLPLLGFGLYRRAVR